MVTGYEVGMFNDIRRIAEALEKIADRLDVIVSKLDQVKPEQGGEATNEGRN
jgi:hypothetical protein